MTARNRTTRKAAKPRVGKYIAIVALMLVIAGIAASVSATYSLAMSWLKDLPDYSDSDAYLLAEPTQVLDADGNVIAQFYMENRTPITKEQCSQYVLWATVDTEDERFYEHNGVDIRGILRAVVAQLSGGSEGASTITQQLVRNTVLSDEQFEQTLSRKVREAYIATQLEQMYSKDDILMMYLNSIYYGAGCYGIEAAAQTYFGKSCADLTIAEAATLAGLPQSPSYYNPLANPESAIERRNVVLAHLLDKGHITQQEYDDAVASDLVLNYTPPEKSGAYAYPYFVDYVKSTLSTQFSTDVIFKGGLTVKTTISPKYQTAAENAVWSVLQYADDERPGVHRPQHRLHSRHGGRPRLQRRPVQPRHDGAPSARLLVQDVHADRRHPGRHEPHRAGERQYRPHGGRLEGKQLPVPELRQHQPAPGDLSLLQHGVRPGHQ